MLGKSFTLENIKFNHTESEKITYFNLVHIYMLLKLAKRQC